MEKRLSSIRLYFQRYTEDVNTAFDFLEWWEKKASSPGAPTIIWEKEVFRIVYGSFNPLSVAGSLAKGGRFNIGGAQRNQFFSHLSMQACLYAASSIDCAAKEAGGMLGNPRIFSLKPRNQLKLWDLHSLVKTDLDYPNLKWHVDSSPLSAIWEYQKVPKISQLLGYYLRKLGGDGLVYPSTKDEKGEVFAFFAKDDEHARTLFHPTEIFV